MLIFKAADLTDNMEATVRFTPENFTHPYHVTLRDLDADEIVVTRGEISRSAALQRAVFWTTPAETDDEATDRLNREN